MFRQSPRRNGRNKGLKIKHILQMSVLLVATIWLLYQLQHTDNNEKPSVTTNISDNLHNDSSNDKIKLGRKGLRPRGKETNVHDHDRKETIEHETDEEDNENEAEEVVQGHENEDMKHVEVGENASTDDGMEKNTKTEYQELKVEMKGHENEKIKSEGMKQSHDEGNGSKNEEATKEVNGSKKSKEGNIPTKENSKESTQESRNEEKEDRSPNPKEMVEMSSPPTDDDENVSSEEVNDNRRKENGEERGENGSSSKGPSVDESESGSNPSHSKSNEDDKAASEEETSTTSSTKIVVKNRKIGNLSRQRVWMKSVKEKTSSDSYLVPSIEPKMNGKSNENEGK